MSDPFATLGLIHKGLNLVSAFAGPSGSMGFMISAALENQRLILAELERIHVGLAEIRSEIILLGAEIRGIIQEQFRDELISSISADIENYAVWLDASISDDKIFEDPEVRIQMQSMLARFQNTIGTLINSPEGRGPHAGFVITLSSSLEIALQTRLRFPEEVVKSSIDKYLRWIDGALSENKDSILNNLNANITLHNKAINELPDNHFFGPLKFKSLQVDGSGADLGNAWVCIVYGKFSGHEKMLALPFQKVKAGLISGGFTSMRNYYLSEELDSEHDIQFITMIEGLTTLEKFPLDGNGFYSGPAPDDLCFGWPWPIQSSASFDDLRKFDDETRLKALLGTHLQAQVDRGKTTLAAMNLYRSKIAFAYKAMIAVKKAQQNLRHSRGFLE